MDVNKLARRPQMISNGAEVSSCGGFLHMLSSLIDAFSTALIISVWTDSLRMRQVRC